MVSNDTIVNDVESIGLIKMRMCIMRDFSTTSCPSGMSYSCCWDSCLHKNLFNNSVDTVDVTITFISILNQLSFRHSNSKSEYSCTIVSSVLQKIDSVTQKVLYWNPCFRILLCFFFRDWFLRNDADDTTALSFFFGCKHKAWESKGSQGEFFEHSS